MGEALPRGRLARLAQELAQERAVADRIAATCTLDAAHLLTTTAPDELRARTAVVALGLHRWYSAIESMLERVERVFGTLPSGPDWHAELLSGAAFEIPEVRPAIVPTAHVDRLRELLRFRHFLRHAYAVELDAAKLRILADDVTAVHADVSRSIAAFEAFLIAAAREA
ncbi:MAG: hypothetical protein IT385_23295 [Deltaproteobacteria bacterium]|nr:hypothetical protein [Deltaproteobacteria bacterium]